MHLLLPVGTALLLGSLHALEADHMAAVSAFAVRRPQPRAALGFGIRWAAGHGGVILVLGTTLVLAGLRLSPDTGHLLERAVGFTLIALGAWTAAGARSLHAHLHAHADGTVHAHLHSHRDTTGHDHGHAATAIGALHGLAGTAPALALLPLARFDSPWLAAGYLALFAIGTAIGMGFYAMIAGWIAGRAAIRSERLARGIAFLTGLLTIGLGFLWLLR